MSLSSATTTTAIESLRARGVATGVAEREAAAAPPELVLAWCAYAANHRHMGPGAVIDGIHSGHMPPQTPHRPSSRDQALYGREIANWLRRHFPDLCKTDPRIIEWERRLHGDAAAARLEHHDQPHYAAAAAVIRLHYQQGRSLTVKRHGPIIRAAVSAANDEAIADYEDIQRRRDAEGEKP